MDVYRIGPNIGKLSKSQSMIHTVKCERERGVGREIVWERKVLLSLKKLVLQLALTLHKSWEEGIKSGAKNSDCQLPKIFPTEGKIE